MPKWISETSEGASISFTIPKKKLLRGLNFCNVQGRVSVERKSRYSTDAYGYPVDQLFYLPFIEISNKTKSRSWIYYHCIQSGVNVGGEWFTYLSHWMFGKDDDEMGAGDEITITVKHRNSLTSTKECGVSFVYEEEEEEEEKDALGYYKAWNHIIGGDLSSFQLTTPGQYFLNLRRFLGHYDSPYAAPGVRLNYKETTKGLFKAFSQRKSNILVRELQVTAISKFEDSRHCLLAISVFKTLSRDFSPFTLHLSSSLPRDLRWKSRYYDIVTASTYMIQ